jgi:hypothetical protein
MTLWKRDKNGKTAAPQLVNRGDWTILGIPGQFVNFLSNWGYLYRERRWVKYAPSLGEVVRAINAYCGTTGYRLFTLAPGQPLNVAIPYSIEIEEMHLFTDYDS